MVDDLQALTPSVESLGWDERLQRWAEEHPGNLDVGRIARVSRGYCLVFTGGEAVLVNSSSERSGNHDAPATGDYVLVDTSDPQNLTIASIAPRQTALRRRMPGRVPEAQVLAANIDYVLVMHGLDQEFSMRRLERQLVIAFDSGAQPVIVLTKADLTTEADRVAELIQQQEMGVDMTSISSLSGEGLDNIANLFTKKQTAVMLGPSGIGKSTLVNALSNGVVQRTGEVRVADRRGRHTTVTRDLIPLPDGGLIVDTPGIREIGLWQAWEGLARTFAELSEAAEECRFADCRHDQEPGCAIQAGLAAGTLRKDRFEHWQSLTAELDEQSDQIVEFNKRTESRQRANAQDRASKQRPNKKRRKGRR